MSNECSLKTFIEHLPKTHRVRLEHLLLTTEVADLTAEVEYLTKFMVQMADSIRDYPFELHEVSGKLRTIALNHKER